MDHTITSCVRPRAAIYFKNNGIQDPVTTPVREMRTLMLGNNDIPNK